ncbi:MAG TPA: malic enzyme-like NAD(P)-binding protein [Anaerolineaceae bacterium]
MIKITPEDVLNYHHLDGRPGKTAVIATKPLETQRDLSLAYTPGVAVPVLEIEKDPNCAYEYTNKGNLVGVISNGTAILGLGNRGPLASKPVMEGKAVLFKKFADIDVFDIEIDAHSCEDLIKVVAALGPTFGGINLEDIRSPECFEVEQTLQEMMDIPVFHDDQHGTAIILAAALLNCLEINGKKLDQIKVVFSGAGAAGIACANQMRSLGVPCSNIWLTDIAGLVYEGRCEEMFPEKLVYAKGNHPAKLAEVLKDADVFIGVSAANLVTPEMLMTMAPDPVVFAMANPYPEIEFELAKATRPDAIVATGRSDFPNQINNVLGFPFIFRGALDVRARKINEEMKRAASHALAALAKEPVPAEVCQAYGVDHLEFGRDYIVPKPLDKRVVVWEAPAVAQAAMETGVSRLRLDVVEYRRKLSEKFGVVE